MSVSEDKNKNKPVNKNPKENKPSISDQAVDSIIQKIGHAESRGQMYDKKTGKIIQNPNGSAKGPFQIVNKTWGGIEKQLGKKLERESWEDNVLAMKHLSKVYINRLEKAGLPVTDSNLYMLHFLGDTGGTNFLKKLKDNPNELASNYVSADAFQENINVFVDKNTGKTRTAAEVYTEMNSRLNDGKGDNAYKPEVKQNNVPVDNLEQFRSQQNFGEQDYNQQEQESTRTQQPRIDPSLNQPNQFAPKKVADNSVPENNPVAAPKMGLGMSGSLDYLPKDFGLAFLSEEELQQQEEEQQLGQDVNMAKYGGEINNSALHNKIKGAFTRNNNFEQGGQMRTTNKEGLLNEFNEGGRHEENRYGGIPQGQGSNGQMNTVEEGETKIGGYVLSDTLKLNDNDIKSLFLPKEIKSGMTFAEASKVVNDYLKEDPNNKILKKTVNKHIDSLTLGNEKARLAKEKLDLAMQQEMNPEMDPNQEMQLGEEFDQNQMFLGGDEDNIIKPIEPAGLSVSQPSLPQVASGVDLTNELSAKSNIGEVSLGSKLAPGISGATGALTSLMSGDKQGAVNGALSAAGSIGGTLIGGPIGGAIGGAIGEGIGGLINGIGSGNKRRNAENSQHIIESNKFNNDFRYGGPDGEQPFPVNGEGYGDDLINKYSNRKNKINFEEPYEINVSDDLDSIENLKSKETYIPQGPYKLSGNFDAKPFDSNKAGIEYDANKERLRKEALEKDNANALGKNPLQYAPILGNALSYLEAKNDKPSVINSGRIDQRFNPRYADERTLQNIVGSELNNTTNALSSATNGSEGALRSNILGAGLNKAKAMSDAYINADNINRGQDNEADKFNYGVNAGNREAGYRDTIFNEGSKSATKDREISARNRLFDSIGGVGREITLDNRIKNIYGGYNSQGDYSPEISAKKLELDEMIRKEEEEKKKNNTGRNGGFFSSMLNHSFENNKLSQAEIEFRKKYQ